MPSRKIKICVTIPDAKTEKTFVAEALKNFRPEAVQKWRKYHGKGDPDKGRKPEKDLVFPTIEKIINEVLLQEKIPDDISKEEKQKRIINIRKNHFTQGKLVKRVADILGNEQHSKNTIKKYVKLFLMKQRSAVSLTDQEKKWLAKHDRKAWERHIFVRNKMVEFQKCLREIFPRSVTKRSLQPPHTKAKQPKKVKRPKYLTGEQILKFL